MRPQRNCRPWLNLRAFDPLQLSGDTHCHITNTKSRGDVMPSGVETTPVIMRRCAGLERAIGQRFVGHARFKAQLMRRFLGHPGMIIRSSSGVLEACWL